MKGKKPTRYQRKFLEEQGIDPRLWYVQKDTLTFMQLVNIETGEIRVVNK